MLTLFATLDAKFAAGALDVALWALSLLVHILLIFAESRIAEVAIRVRLVALDHVFIGVFSLDELAALDARDLEHATYLKMLLSILDTANNISTAICAIN